MRIKLVLAGFGSTLLGTIGLLGVIQKLATCATLSKFNEFTWLKPNDICEFPNYSDGTLGVFLIIGIILLVAGIIKKSPVHTSSKTQLGE